MNKYPFAKKVKEQLERAGVFWLYQGEPRPDAPHALLTSDKHSDGYVDVGAALKGYPMMRKTFAQNLIIALENVYCDKFDLVVGADTSSTDLAADVAMIAKINHIRMIKTEDEQGKRQVWHPENKPIQEGDVILQIEELITTSFSALQVREGIRRANPNVEVNFVPFLPVVVERSDPDNRVVQVEESIILSLLQLSIRNYERTACPYCKAGSIALKPKMGDNWVKLTRC